MPARRSRPVLIAGLAVLSALGLPPAREACAQQVVLSNIRGLDFGRFVAGGGGTVTISSTGLRSRSGAVVLLNSPSAGQAAFAVAKSGGDGGANNVVVISLPANGSIRLTSGTGSMPVGDFVNSPATLVAVPDSGTTLSIGATLTVAPNQPRGNYSGSFPLIVNFQ